MDSVNIYFTIMTAMMIPAIVIAPYYISTTRRGAGTETWKLAGEWVKEHVPEEAFSIAEEAYHTPYDSFRVLHNGMMKPTRTPLENETVIYDIGSGGCPYQGFYIGLRCQELGDPNTMEKIEEIKAMPRNMIIISNVVKRSFDEMLLINELGYEPCFMANDESGFSVRVYNQTCPSPVIMDEIDGEWVVR